MQSWGLSSRFSERDTAREPTKSGVIGLLCAAMGKPRTEQPDDGFPTLSKLSAMPMAVRVDNEGAVRRDFHTVGGGDWLGKPYGVAKADGARPTARNADKFTVVSNRYYLADACFIVALEGPVSLVEQLDQALTAPIWPLFLGRKAFTPGEPVQLPPDLARPALESENVEAALRRLPWLGHGEPPSEDARLRLQIECDKPEGEPRQDVPVSFESAARVHIVRHVSDDDVAMSELPTRKEVISCTSHK
jgi:CRISPR system Cascade subunit CasD